MRKEFRPQNHRTVYQSQLSSRKQGLNEPVQVYYYDVLNLCMRVNKDMSDEDKLFHLCQGLKSTLLEKVMPFEPRTCKELLQKCKSIEEAEVMANNRPHYNYLLLQEKKPLSVETLADKVQSANSVPPANTEVVSCENRELEKTLKALADSVKETNELTKKMVETLTSRPRNNYRNNQRQVTNLNGQLVCYRCNTPGHTSRYCYLNALQGQPDQAGGQVVPTANVNHMQNNQNYIQSNAVQETSHMHLSQQTQGQGVMSGGQTVPNNASQQNQIQGNL